MFQFGNLIFKRSLGPVQPQKNQLNAFYSPIIEKAMVIS